MSSWPVIVADDHAVVREGLRTVLEQYLPCSVVGMAASGAEAISLARKLQPALLVTDMVMPGLSGLEVVRQARQAAPAMQVVVFSMHAEESYVREALRAGAAGYVLKESLASELVAAINAAMQGRRYVSQDLSDRILEIYAQDAPQGSFDPYQQLTDREREVLVLSAEGLNTAAIASRLVLSPRTVESHRASMMHKLGLRTIADLVRYAIRRGLVVLDK